MNRNRSVKRYLLMLLLRLVPGRLLRGWLLRRAGVEPRPMSAAYFEANKFFYTQTMGKL